MNPRIRQWALAIAAACAASACGDALPTETTVASPARPTFSITDEVVGLLKRTEPLTDGLTETRVIGPRGGHIDVPKAGFRIEFPRGAVSVPRRITVTALRGDNVAYMFEPHGLYFNTPVTIRQSLHKTAAWKTDLANKLMGAYFDRLVVDPTETFARSRERRPSTLKDSKEWLEFSIEHFSGYMVSTGEVSIEVKSNVSIDITSR